MKLKQLLTLIPALIIVGCSSNEPGENPRLSKASTYSLSIYATDRANINIYSPKDDAISVVSDEVNMDYDSSAFDSPKGETKTSS